MLSLGKIVISLYSFSLKYTGITYIYLDQSFYPLMVSSLEYLWTQDVILSTDSANDSTGNSDFFSVHRLLL